MSESTRKLLLALVLIGIIVVGIFGFEQLVAPTSNAASQTSAVAVVVSGTALPPSTNFDSGKLLKAADLKALLQNVSDIKTALANMPSGGATATGNSLSDNGQTAFVVKNEGNGNYAFGAPGHFDNMIGGQPVGDLRYESDIQKLYTRSFFVTEAGDTPDLGIRRFNGTYENPQGLSKNDIIGLLYWQALGSNGDFQSSTPGSPYYGRSAEIFGRVTETPTGTARGGALVFATTADGSVVTRERAWISDKGWLVLGSAGQAQENGTIYDSSNTEGWGSLSIIANDDAVAPAIAIRQMADPGLGFNVSVDQSSGQLRIETVNNGVRTTAFTIDRNTGTVSFPELDALKARVAALEAKVK